MTYDPERHHRRSIRLKGHDYAGAGTYFVTICAQDREPLFGEIVEAEVCLSDLGRIVEEEWLRTPSLRPRIVLGEYVVMPNHMHGIIMVVEGRDTAPPCPYASAFGKPVAGSLSTVIGAFKAMATKRINDLRDTRGARVWQSNYYEHIIRNERELVAIRRYILGNPAQWGADRENPACLRVRAAPMR